MAVAAVDLNLPPFACVYALSVAAGTWCAVAFWAELQLYGDITLSTSGGLQPAPHTVFGKRILQNVNCNPLGVVSFPVWLADWR